MEDLQVEKGELFELLEKVGERVPSDLKGRLGELGEKGLFGLCLFREQVPLVLLSYQKEKSTIRGLFFFEKADFGLLEHLLDRLIEEESLVGAEIPVGETELIDMLIRYGFRPFYELEREGGTYIRLELSAAVYFEKLPRLKPKVNAFKEKVVVQRVYEDSVQGIRRALEEAFSLLGGIERFVKPGQKVVLKPNVVAEHGMREGRYVGGVVTDKRVLKALIELLLPTA